MKTTLRCGWVVTEGISYVAPDGKTFTSRKDASKYYNQNVPKLEPQRQDGWVVYMSDGGTHQDWRAPDGEVLHSYTAAKTYAASAGLKLLGRDGITSSIFSFFTCRSNGTTNNMHTQKDTQPEAPIDLTLHHPQKQRPPSRQQPRPEEPAPAPPALPPRKFRVPIQNSCGRQLQKLCREAALHRNKARHVVYREQTPRDTYNKFIIPRVVSTSMILKVRFHTHTHTHLPLHTPVLHTLLYACRLLK